MTHGEDRFARAAGRGVARHRKGSKHSGAARLRPVPERAQLTSRWRSEDFARLLRDPEVRAVHGDTLVLIANGHAVAARPREDLRREFSAWLRAKGLAFDASVLDAARIGMAAALADCGEGVPFLFLGARRVTLAVVRVETGELGPWVWSFTCY